MGKNNRYAKGNPLMIDSGTFWRCDHGHTQLGKPCLRCGIWYPRKWLRDFVTYMKG